MNILKSVDWRKRRCELGLTQTDFWKVVHVAQSISSRYERELTQIPTPVRLLLAIIYAPNPDSVEVIQNLRNIAAQDKRELFGYSQKDDHTKLLPLRKALKLNQSEFWGRLGITQSGGSRYENGSRAISKVVEMLLSVAYGKQEFCDLLVDRLRNDYTNKIR